jgi:hypothetical protein
MMSEAPSVQNRPRVVGKAAGDAKRAAISLPWPDSAKAPTKAGAIGR